MNQTQKCALVYVSVAKRCLQYEMPDELRLRFLKVIDNLSDSFLTPEVLAIVEPMDSRGDEIFCEARKLGKFQAINVCAQRFDLFAALNPSVRVASEKAAGRWYGSAAPPSPII